MITYTYVIFNFFYGRIGKPNFRRCFNGVIMVVYNCLNLKLLA